ncbi:hypothetical protein H696_00229 [Fonticula alba]|uniref:Uncharacterized protein n=1 Tax=Fonticula alba TaxID=691883 RepID=A0A058ZFD9_FONAL|nr:hypothetical protein H696_00229 [Fonticula alba]KCV72648.1 hypothetical protein H696_00229 [Fonticula alba]|eukprot:XP_009492349.1 hypothetical protein H696_00229 [Fonticula alba]
MSSGYSGRPGRGPASSGPNAASRSHVTHSRHSRSTYSSRPSHTRPNLPKKPDAVQAAATSSTQQPGESTGSKDSNARPQGRGEKNSRTHDGPPEDTATRPRRARGSAGSSATTAQQAAPRELHRMQLEQMTPEKASGTLLAPYISLSVLAHHMRLPSEASAKLDLMAAAEAGGTFSMNHMSLVPMEPVTSPEVVDLHQRALRLFVSQLQEVVCSRWAEFWSSIAYAPAVTAHLHAYLLLGPHPSSADAFLVDFTKHSPVPDPVARLAETHQRLVFAAFCRAASTIEGSRHLTPDDYESLLDQSNIYTMDAVLRACRAFSANAPGPMGDVLRSALAHSRSFREVQQMISESQQLEARIERLTGTGQVLCQQMADEETDAPDMASDLLRTLRALHDELASLEQFLHCMGSILPAGGLPGSAERLMTRWLGPDLASGPLVRVYFRLLPELFHMLGQSFTEEDFAGDGTRAARPIDLIHQVAILLEARLISLFEGLLDAFIVRRLIHPETGSITPSQLKTVTNFLVLVSKQDHAYPPRYDLIECIDNAIGVSAALFNFKSSAAFDEGLFADILSRYFETFTAEKHQILEAFASAGSTAGGEDVADGADIDPPLGMDRALFDLMRSPVKEDEHQAIGMVADILPGQFGDGFLLLALRSLGGNVELLCSRLLEGQSHFPALGDTVASFTLEEMREILRPAARPVSIHQARGTVWGAPEITTNVTVLRQAGGTGQSSKSGMISTDDRRAAIESTRLLLSTYEDDYDDTYELVQENLSQFDRSRDGPDQDSRAEGGRTTGATGAGSRPDARPAPTLVRPNRTPADKAAPEARPSSSSSSTPSPATNARRSAQSKKAVQQQRKNLALKKITQ